MKLSEYIENHGDMSIDPTRLDEIFNLKRPCERKRPKYRDKYQYLTDEGYVEEATWTDNIVDQYRWLRHNVFLTPEELAFESDCQRVENELRLYAEEHNEYEIDWHNIKQMKIYLGYDCQCDEFFFDRTFSYINAKEIYFTSEKITQAAIDAVGEDRIKKYYFRVKNGKVEQ